MTLEPLLRNAGNFAATAHDDRIAGWEVTKEAIENPTYAILDVRSDAEWTGADKMGTKRGGHVPGAHHLEWRRVIDPASKRFKSSLELSRMFAEAGLSPGREIIVYCQGGIRAAHSALALQLAGYDRVRNYERSWSEWGNRADLPIAVEDSGATETS